MNTAFILYEWLGFVNITGDSFRLVGVAGFTTKAHAEDPVYMHVLFLQYNGYPVGRTLRTRKILLY